MSKLHNMLPYRTALVAAAALVGSAAAQSQQYCSPINTGSNFQVVTNLYNSYGSCSNVCVANYAFAVVQYQNCWCTNYAPSQQTSVGQCNSPCPGYPSNLCGNEAAGLYGYIALNVAPSGTRGAGGGSSGTSAATSNSPSSSQTPSSPDSSSLVDTAPSQVTSIQVVTISGAATTRTVTSTPTVAAGSSADLQRDSTGLSGGAIAGIVIGVLAGLALLFALLFLLWRRKRQADEDGAVAGTGSRPGSNSTKRTFGRHASVLSKSGLLSRGGRPSMTETDGADGVAGTFATPGSRHGHHSSRNSMLFGSGGGSEPFGGPGVIVHPDSPLDSHSGSGASGGGGMHSRRPSRPLVYDQRLNPSALFANHDNGSRISMQDQQDYSRPLGIANPDPRASFDSRLSRVE